MTEFLYIVYEVILPILIIVALGYIVQLKYNLDLSTLSRLTIFYILPGFIFMTLYRTAIDLGQFLSIFGILIIYAGVSFLIAQVIGHFMGLSRDRQTLFTNSNIFYNAGNYGVPVNDLVFRSDPFAMMTQVMIIIFQNIFVFTYGIVSLSAKDTSKLKAMLGYFKMPIFYAVLLGLLASIFNVNLPSPIESSFEYIRQSMVAIVLFILGAQIAQIKFTRLSKSAFVATLTRLIVGPVMMFPIILIFGLDGIVAQVLLIAAALPSAVNSVIIAQQYTDDSSYAAEIVMMTTLLSPITVSATIFIANIYFG